MARITNEAVEAYMQQLLRPRDPVLAEMEAERGSAHPETATVRNNLAMLLNATGRAGDALPLLQQALSSPPFHHLLQVRSIRKVLILGLKIRERQ